MQKLEAESREMKKTIDNLMEARRRRRPPYLPLSCVRKGLSDSGGKRPLQATALVKRSAA